MLTPEVFVQTLPMLGKGMLGIFIVTGIIVLAITAMNKLAARGSKEAE